MKKSNITLAVFAVIMATAAAAKAGDVNFDGKVQSAGAQESIRTVAFAAAAVNVPDVNAKETVSPAAKTVQQRSLNDILNGLSAAQKLLVFESLAFNKDGKLASIYTKDIIEVLGNEALKEVLNKFGIKTDTRSGVVRASKDMWCVSPGTCGTSPGYSCTENC